MKRFLLFIILLISTGTASAEEAWCAAHPNECVCSETFQSTAYNQVAVWSTGASYLGNSTTTKKCRYDGNDLSIFANYGPTTFAGTLAVSTDATVLGALPNRNSSAVARFLRVAGDNLGSQSSSTYISGHDAFSLGNARRTAVRWYQYYSPNYENVNKVTCNNNKFSVPRGASARPQLVLQWYTHGQTQMYAFVSAAGYGWSWSGHSDFDGFGNGPRPNNSAGVSFSSTLGKWMRYEVVLRRPRVADAATPGVGFDYELWLTNVTAGTPPVLDQKFSTGCTSCMFQNGAPYQNFVWDSSIHQTSDLTATIMESYRQLCDATNCAGSYQGVSHCNGWQGWLYLAVAKWDTDAGQMIGPASEVEGGSGPIDTTPPAAPRNVRAL